MAYNRTFNPDSLPAFAEPERKNGPAAPGPAPPQQQAYNQAQNQPSHAQQYSNKPPPPLPQQQQQQQQQQQYQQQYQQQNHGPGRRLSPGMAPPNQGYSASPPQNYGFSSPPPQNNYGRPQQNHNRPPPMSRPPPTPAPPSNSGDAALWPLFKAVDKDGSGHLTEKELRAALVNGDWSSFDPHTVKMMIRMFDTDRSGTITFEEFCGLWGFLAAWRSLFDRFDADRSGNISLDEYTNALVAFGYRLSGQFVETLFRTYDKRGENAISFDLFVQSCISLKRMTDVFKKYDDDRDGYITLSFEDFLSEIIRQK